MRRSTLEIVLDRACFFGLREFERKDLLSGVLPHLPGDKCGLLIELENSELFERNAFGGEEVFENFADNWKMLAGEGSFKYPNEKEKWFNCYTNISALKRKFARIAVLLPREKNEYINGIEKSCIAVFEKKDLNDASIEDLLKLKIAEMNIQNTPLFLIAKYAWLFTFILCALPFAIPSKPAEQPSILRNITGDVLKYSDKSEIVHVFKEGESLRQIARFAVGKYNSLVTTEDMIAKYLSDNDLSIESEINAGDTLRLKLPAFNNPNSKAMQPAWSFYTGLLNDSLAYITELYNVSDNTKRYHDGIDIAARYGTRILAPFSGTAWTMEDERGGLMIAIAGKKDILVFMHCGQRFYLNGQTVMEGDPIASVGTSGHTTGPHTHLVAGKIVADGEKHISGLRYRSMNPFTWYTSTLMP
jgi:murein DD-endopeptidase MepM/ murein hydrolase activator NlpD